MLEANAELGQAKQLTERSGDGGRLKASGLPIPTIREDSNLLTRAKTSRQNRGAGRRIHGMDEGGAARAQTDSNSNNHDDSRQPSGVPPGFVSGKQVLEIVAKDEARGFFRYADFIQCPGLGFEDRRVPAAREIG